jgi:hypothetical protein
LKGLEGNIPDEIGNITELRNIYTEDCLISGSLPESIAMLKKLHHIEIWYSALSGPIPVVLRDMKGLREITLNDNNLTGGLPEWICELTWLTSLWYHNHFINQSFKARRKQTGRRDTFVYRQPHGDGIV